LTLCDAIQMEHKEFQTIAMLFGHGSERFTEMITALGLVGNS
jgi:hypothetical protein